MTDYPSEAPSLEVHPIYKGDDWSNMPHQKIVIIDGLVAFKGSANLTTDTWRKAADGKELIEVVTDVGQVWDLNNRLFAPLWAERSPFKKDHCRDLVTGDYIELPF